MKVNVTYSHIKKGSRRGTGSCPIALAVKDTFDLKKVTVYPSRIFSGSRNFCVDKDTEETLERFISRFDEGLHVSPFNFDVLI